MDEFLQSFKIIINEKIYVKDPESTDLGKKIIEQSILLIHEIGIEKFTFKKLGVVIGSNESSVYRYFENKHKLLLYLTSWYWSWVEYKLVFSTNNITKSKKRLTIAIENITMSIEEDSTFSHINEVILHKIVINEYSKSYLTKEVDIENKNGYFVIYKRLISRLSMMISDYNPEYAFPSSLASTVLEGSLHQFFLKEHFPTLTDCHEPQSPTQYFTQLVLKTLK
ncbi:TetR/AcrR family transcriptional regulator [Cellulophaga baltica]|uniref:TetR/AcrR family transcriptional regulator n=1 Tax=Cellulophaga TaxID=104264 RepID=UPI001C073024|nr:MULTISPECIES: TetR/AcrR family transcriptional regulator [Cellulophaga]MBU2995572.1 TetR/AcrR family transcriptional regulator [Cellulophaga baltica]MDO6766966.1 TetR/AcrR family transcriptional regulator [Cellulophaga sp. 1_MG-2023]